MRPLPITLLLMSTLGAPICDAAQNTIILDEQGVRNLRIETVVADYQDFEETVFAIGRIVEIPASRSVLSTRIPGRVTALDAFEGDTVTKGQRIAVIESRQLGDPPPTVELFAPQDGLVVASHIRLGQPVEPSAELMDIVDRSTVWAVAQIPEQEAAEVEIGSRAYIRIPALGDGLLKANATRFGVEADPQAGTVAAIFEIANPDGRLRPGMRAEFSVVLRSRSDVLAIPRKAVQGDPANRIVFVKDFELPNAFLRAPVVLGEQNERYIEVIEGLFPGDEVVTRGSYGLSFSGSRSGMSLKEALDAAHGHEHNEDGSEITPEQRAAHASEQSNPEEHSHHDESSGLKRIMIIYALIMTVAVIMLAQRLWTKSKAPEGGASHA